jgi:hypothetical protein
MTNVLPRRVPRARAYFWRLVMLIPALGMLGAGAYYHLNVDPGGKVSGIKLRTKDGLVGQASEAVANVNPSNPDLYLRVYLPGDNGAEIFSKQMVKLIKKDTPVGNGLTWDLPKSLPMQEIGRVDVWDHHAITKDKQLDRITITGWQTEGQRYRLELVGAPNTPPAWALPVAAAGGALTLAVIAKFVWDQVV